MIIAFIDIGTNSNKLSIYDYNIDKEIYSDRIVTRLGHNSFKTNILSQDGIDRCILALDDFFNKIKEYNISNVRITATSCVRDAINKEYFSKIIKEKYNIELEILSGQREAELIFNGVCNNLDQKVLLVDIGGGSTEFVLGYQNEIIYIKSFNIGAVRLYDKFFINENELIGFEKSCEYVRNITKNTFREIKSIGFDLLIGSSGTWTNLDNYLSLIKKDFSFIDNSIYELINLSLEDRKKYIKPDRLDIIISGASIVKVILDELKPNKVKISDYSLKEGLINQYKTKGE